MTNNYNKQLLYALLPIVSALVSEVMGNKGVDSHGHKVPGHNILLESIPTVLETIARWSKEQTDNN
jgi:hypothetical protein